VFENPSVNLYVADVDRSVAFYTELLGFTETFRTPESGPPAHVEVAMGGFVLGLAAVEAARSTHGLAPGPGPSGEIVLWTSDVDAAHATLAAAGVPSLSEPHDFLGGRNRAAWVADPDGNPVEIVQRLI
jgi:catechol 2,3-dioxygenase-like lactoylglutathione lyase family enzyme